MESNLDKTSGANNVWNNHEMVAVIKTQTHNQKTRVYISIMISASTRQRPGTSVSSFKPSFPDTQGDWGFQRSSSEITLDVIFISEDSLSLPHHTIKYIPTRAEERTAMTATHLSLTWAELQSTKGSQRLHSQPNPWASCPNIPTGSFGSQPNLWTQYTTARKLPLELHRLLRWYFSVCFLWNAGPRPQ